MPSVSGAPRAMHRSMIVPPSIDMLSTPIFLSSRKSFDAAGVFGMERPGKEIAGAAHAEAAC